MSKYSLKASDALQLTCALDVFSVLGSDFHFVCSDKKLCESAELEGLHILKPEAESSKTYLKIIQ